MVHSSHGDSRARASHRQAARTSSVLVIGHDAAMNAFIRHSLAEDYHVTAVPGSHDAIEHAPRTRPVLIVIDVGSSDQAGGELIRTLRHGSDLRRVPVLLVSTQAEEALVIDLLSSGAQDLILKPFSEKMLALRVRNLILSQQSRDQIDRLREEAEGANRAKDEFLAMLGHELRNPLSPILTALQLMKLQGHEQWDRARTIIERQVTHLTRLVDDLLDVSRIARGKVELKTEIVEMADLVVRAIEMASPLIEQRRHVLSVDVPRRGLRVDADPARLAQVISNLLMNAAKYTAPGGRIRVSAHRTTGEVVLRVRDSGVGIKRDVLPQVFDLFIQERQSIDRSQGGLGLGLTIVRSLVERHGGSVEARSGGPGCGSEFIVRLPRVPLAHGAAGEDDLASPFADGRHVHGPRVLVVDDNEDAAEMLVDALTQRGYEARGSYDALSALQLAGEFQPEIAVLDIGLPVMDGYELAARLRTLPGLADLRLVAVTGYGQPSDRQRTREAGFDHHLVKPIEINALESALNAPATARIFRH